jgi:hypothetical protein
MTAWRSNGVREEKAPEAAPLLLMRVGGFAVASVPLPQATFWKRTQFRR